MVMTQQKFVGGTTGHSMTSTPWKFDAVRWRNLTVPGSTTSFRHVDIVLFL